MSSRPCNLVFLHAHDMGRYNAAYGHALPTPHLAAEARRAVLFRDAHCAAPTCSPSRAAMLTGRTPHEVGVMGLIHRGWDLNDYDAHLAALLARHGWETALAGLQHELREPERVYQTHLATPAEDFFARDQLAATAATTWLRQPERATRPFYLFLGLFQPHLPWPAADPARFPADRTSPPPPLPDHPEIRTDWADYAAGVELADNAFGQVFAALDATGLAANTIVVVTTDHGVALPHMKCHLTAHGTGVTLLIRDPRQPATAGRACDALVSHLDLVPTLCELLAVPVPANVRGTSLGPLLRDPAGPPVRDDVFAEVTYHAAHEPKRGVRTKRHSYQRSFDPDRRRPLANTDNSRSKTLLAAAGWGDLPTAAESLFDLLHDPQETHNLAADPAHAVTLAALRARLDTWMRHTADPLLSGPVPLPPGANAQTRECYDASGPRVFGA